MLLSLVVDSNAQVIAQHSIDHVSAKEHLLSLLPPQSNFPYTTFLLRDFDCSVHLKRLNFLPEAEISQQSFNVGLTAVKSFFSPAQQVRIMAVNRFSQLLLLAEPIPEPQPHPRPVSIKIELCAELPRAVPEFKTTAWLQQREALFPVPRGFEEVVFGLEADEELLEGLSSNFWVLRKDGVLQTAPFDKVLPGSMAKRLIELCQDLRIEFQCPSVKEMKNWQGAFLTSASRFVLPVGVIEFGGERIEFEENDFIYALRRKLLIE